MTLKDLLGVCDIEAENLDVRVLDNKTNVCTRLFYLKEFMHFADCEIIDVRLLKDKELEGLVIIAEKE